MKAFLQKKYFGIRGFEYLAVAAFYFFFAYLYHVTLWYNRSFNDLPIKILFDPLEIMRQAGLQYLTFLIFYSSFIKVLRSHFSTLSLIAQDTLLQNSFQGGKVIEQGMI